MDEIKDWEVEAEGGRLLTSERRTRSITDMEAEARNLRRYTKVFTLAQIVGIFVVGLLVAWLSGYRGGFAWRSNPGLEFNWHPLLMVTGLIFFYANGILIYRAFRNEPKRKLKILHALFHFSAVLLAIIGLQAVFDSHNLASPPMPNLYSLHSWIGIIVVVLFACQFVLGFVSFLAPGLRHTFRSFYMPIHVYFGMAIFLGAVAAALTGLNEKAIFTLQGEYSKRAPEGVLMNSISLLIVLFCGLVLYLVGNEAYRRRATEDETLLNGSVLE